eukprot:NODE_6675_length_614_cov_18.254867_g4018_i1.p2 GENE.NODE_6675_length_614_cov_18.254867_g4018_i1~~NODE_6675_length_614_cov_18.254867_g4018_i1.p2  ORF type:complete len:109 (-),score=23.08 NODE_6675_length_614_cov_18.254867_g4018_i1:194-520(-)
MFSARLVRPLLAARTPAVFGTSPCLFAKPDRAPGKLTNAFANFPALNDQSIAKAPGTIPDALKVALTRGDEDVIPKDFQATEITIPTSEGEIGIQPGHEYFLVRPQDL